MAYSTPAMIRQALVPSSDGAAPPSPPSRTAADLSDDQLTTFIAEADAQIDSYVGGRYAVPVQPVVAGADEDGTMVGAIPHPVDYWSRNLAAYFATLSYRGSADFTDQDPVARRYNATMDALKMVAAGTAQLQIPANVSGTASVGAGTALNPYIGDLFDPRDWSLRPMDPNWPLTPGVPCGGGYW